MLLYMRGDGMSKWHSLMEYIQFPLKILFVGTFLLGAGYAIINPNLSVFWSINNDWVILISELIRYIGGLIIAFFPLLVYAHVLSHKFESSTPVAMGLLSYILINVAMIFFINTSFESYYYENVLGLAINFNSILLNKSGLICPFNTGIFSLLLAYGITMYGYRKSRRYSIFGITSFVDHDAWAAIFISIVSVICGIGFAFIWPIVIQGLNVFFTLIANDISNPVNMFLYGVFERIAQLLDLVDLPRQIFWFSEAGGTWLNNVGIKYAGDVAIWTAQKAQAIGSTTSGSFITPYYIINIFIIPSFMIAYYTLCTGKQDRKRYIVFILFACIVSVLFGNPFPAEIVMLILAPMLYAVYLVIVGLLYAGLNTFNVVIGYSFTENIMLANPGSGLDLLVYSRNPYVLPSVMRIILIGLAVALIFFLLTRFYFKKYTLHFYQFEDADTVCASIVNHLGGLDNITSIESTPDKLVVQLSNVEAVDSAGLHKYGMYLILESRNGWLIRMGNISTVVRDYVIKEKEKQENNEKPKDDKASIESHNA